MITRSTILALRVLLHILAHGNGTRLTTPRQLADALGESPTYTAKVVSQLVRRGILESRRGARGGVRLARPPQHITLLDVLEAVQGPLLGDYCPGVADKDLRHTCGFHQAAYELHTSMVRVLRRWTLRALAQHPRASSRALNTQCYLFANATTSPEKETHHD